MPQGSRDVNRLLRDLRSQGFEVIHGSRHFKVYHPKDPSKFVIVPGSMGEGRAYANLLADLRRKLGYVDPSRRSRPTKKVARTA